MSNQIVLGNVGKKLEKWLEQFSRTTSENKIYDENAKKLDLTKVMTNEEISKALSSKATSSWMFDNSTMFERFFDLALDRTGRYSEYEEIVYRIPEASSALQIYVDSILSPDAGDTDKKLIIDTARNDDTANIARNLIEIIFSRSKFYNVLPQIVYTSLLYGDAFVELEPTSNGVRYIVHPPKNCTIIYDSKTDIELGLLVINDDTNSSLLKEMLSDSYPVLKVDLPQNIISIVSDKKLSYKKSSDYRFNKKPILSDCYADKIINDQIEELVKDIFKDEGAKYKYLAPHRYVRFPIYYNNNYYPYGTSVLDSSRSIAKQLLLIESALAIYRATRTPLRNLWTLEVSQIPPDQIPTIIRGVMAKVRRQKIIDGKNDGKLSIDSIPEIMGEQDDIWTTQINGVRQLTHENLTSPDITPATNDADYFKKKLLSSLGIPPSYLAEENGSTRALLTLEDIRFSRTIKKLQSNINDSLLELTNLCFILIGKPQYVDFVKVTLPQLNSIEANLKCENLEKRLGTASSFIDLFPNVPKLWILKNLVGITDDEINEMKLTLKEQKDMKIFADQEFIDNTNSKVDSDDRGGSSHRNFGGGFNSSFDDDFSLDDDLNMDNGNDNLNTNFDNFTSDDNINSNEGNDVINDEMSELEV